MNLADDPELLASMKAAGFIRVFPGIETQVEASLERSSQATEHPAQGALQRTQHSATRFRPDFVVDFVSDTDDVFDRQVELIEESAISIAMVGLLQPLPGTLW